MSSLAELVQLKRAEEQVNPDREDRAATARLKVDVRWYRRVNRGEGKAPMRVFPIRLPANVVEMLSQHGPPTVVARGIILRWAQRRPPKRGGSMGGP